MIGFYFHARPMMNGHLVELAVYRGGREQHDTLPVGTLSFDRSEWDAFRTVIIGGMRAASYARVPIEFMDGTRRELGAGVSH
jgi:hypothetical protein